MADAFLRLAKHKTDITILPEVKNALLQYGRALMGDQGAKMVEQMATPEKIDDLLDRVQGVEKEIAETTRALTRMTISPNVIRGGNKVNVIPDIAEGEVDTRVLLGQDEKCATNVVEKAIQGTGVEIAEVRFTPPSSSPTDTQFIQQLIAVLRKNAGDVGTIMMLNTGMTDSRFFRALGGQAYGFVPAAPTQNLRDILPGVHGHDEKIDLASIEFATKYLFDVSITVLR
jgi:acetylornithine deacetylase/succinyl-diaminopimelate desuccinylase-like protein